MKKKFLSIILAIVMIIPCLFSFVACGDDKGKGNGNGGSGGGGGAGAGGDSAITITFIVDDSTYTKVGVADGVFEMPANPTKTDLAFKGWYFDKDTWENQFTAQTEVTESVTVYARFGDLLSLNFYLGNNLVESMKMDGCSTITLPDEPNIADYKFEGWYFVNAYSGNLTTTKVTEDYFVNNPSTSGRTVKAKLTRITKDNSQTGTYTISNDGKYLYMGEYPTTLKKSNVSITSQTPDEDGYYLGSDGSRYAKVEKAKVSAEMPSGIAWFSDLETLVKNDQTYYFKVEPVKWRILENDGDTALVHSDQILFTHIWDDGTYTANDIPDYETSAVHEYLNTTVYDSLFSDKEKSVILTSWVDNGKDEIGWGLSNPPSPWADFASKLFLPSFNALGGKKIDTAAKRKLFVSDYLRAQGVATYEDSNYNKGYGYFWGRTKDPLVQRNFVMYAMPNSSYGAWHVKNEFGVVPMFRIDL